MMRRFFPVGTVTGLLQQPPLEFPPWRGSGRNVF
jgi:hypothetical protein